MRKISEERATCQASPSYSTMKFGYFLSDGHRIILRALAIFILMGTGCDQDRKKSSDKYNFVEYVAVEGECWEDHVKQSVIPQVKYRGELVHWENQTKKTHSRYGSVTNWETLNTIIEEIETPNRYYPPFIVQFDDIGEKDFSSDRMRLSGISRHSGNEGNRPGYKTTCVLKAVKRLDRIPPDKERW